METMLVVAVAVAIVGIAALLFAHKLRTDRMREGFGPEYEHAIAESGSGRRATSELRQPERRRERLDIRPLDPDLRDRFSFLWRDVQQGFVDEPHRAIRNADSLVSKVMRERGYPMEEFDQRAADISVDHPQVVENYRAAHAISLASQHGKATTEDVRQAMIHYRALFGELLADEPSGDVRIIQLPQDEQTQPPR